ncbi:protein crumbs homolog 1-like [Synchiropus splendidus]|uniref:protein crumbs homolog 1-like n=1 Tax=Synchiropus splendidus TaxID=270530 RepID=UPI00237EDF67|nr:protein crumbs homolog 1-like [Synchiropus splendidus]
MWGLRVDVWIWLVLIAGCVCDEQVGGCDEQPCQNGGICQSHNGTFSCLCSQESLSGRLYGGDTCTVALTGCDGSQCENAGVCSPLFLNHQHTYACICRPGFSGPKCQTSTTFSFESRGFLQISTQQTDPLAPLNVTFSFRTDRPVGSLLQRRAGDLLLSVQLMEGRLSLRSLRAQGTSTVVQELPAFLSNNRWHTVEASLGGVISLIRLLCSEGNCTQQPGDPKVLQQSSTALKSKSVRQTLVIGVDSGQDGPPAFLGCIRDLFVDSHLVVADSHAQVNVTVGCSNKDKCEESPCQNRGRCVSQGWRRYTCECLRPYEGPNCAEEYVTARFGGDNLESYAIFSLNNDPEDTLTISMFIRTRQPTGLLLILANSTSQYLRVWLDSGKIKVQVNNFESIMGEGEVNDGQFHLVSVKLEGAMAMLYQSSQTHGSVRIRHVHARSGDLVFVGGLPDPRASASFGGYFKGCVQDLRFNNKRLQFYPVTTRVESHNLQQLMRVTQGCGSNNACTVNPCLNGGVCYSMWDDFICSCPPNTAGRRCEEVKWCELLPCPTSTVCQPRPSGFECLSNVTFRAGSERLRLQSNGRIQQKVDDVSLSFRSRQTSAVLLQAKKDSTVFSLSLQDSVVVMKLQSGFSLGSPVSVMQSRSSVNDGEWHSVNISRHMSKWVMAVDGVEEDSVASLDLEFLKDGADIVLGGRQVAEKADLSGCLGPVEIGGILLPFHLDTELKLPRPQEGQFHRVDLDTAPQFGCWGATVCVPNPCQNEGTCKDEFDKQSCVCTSEWTGPLCQEPTDSCHYSPCIFGNCTNKDGGYRCSCEPGYTGEQCEREMDVCENNNCSSGATCLRGHQNYACLCPQNWTGVFCNEKIPEIPWYIEAKTLPQFPVSVCTGTRRNYSCFNGGNCSNAGKLCTCQSGFTGQWCEKDVDECASGPCMNGGFCLNYINSFECVCDINYSGVHCQMDVSDFYLYIFLGLWQNLFQLVSYLVIRLDDEPEIEWVFNIND